VAFVNAWRTDFSDEPLTAIMSAVDYGLRPFLGKQTVKNAWRAAVRSGGPLAISLTKNVAGKIVSKYAGDIASEVFDATFETTATQRTRDNEKPMEADPLGVEKAVEEVVDKLADSALESMMKAFRTQQRSIETFRSQLAKVAKSLQHKDTLQPIFVLIDELDRCRPLYAIRMLEAVKHLFDTDGVVFIVATDTEQLAESVRAVYGANFDSTKYLYRFFDRTYRFRNPDRAEFISYLFERFNVSRDNLAFPSELGPERLALRLFDDFNTSLRDMEQCFDLLHSVCTLWDKPIRLELGYVLALIILYHAGRYDEYARLSGQIIGPWEGTLIAHPSTLISYQAGGYGEKPRIVKGTTIQMLEAYKRALDKSLTDIVVEKMPDNPIAQWVTERFREEFSLLHGNRSYVGKPVPTVIREYYRYIELAVRFEGEEEPAAQ
jgi:hypothetical protein